MDFNKIIFERHVIQPIVKEFINNNESNDIFTLNE